MKGRVGTKYVYHANLLDTVDSRTNLKDGDLVVVVNLPGAPKANTMGQCYVADPKSGTFIGMVSTNSLHTIAEYKEYLRTKLKEMKPAPKAVLDSATVEELCARHDSLVSDLVRKGDRALVDNASFERLFTWQFREYYGLMHACVNASGDAPEFRRARRLLRKAQLVLVTDPRLATVQAEAALQWIHRWIDRISDRRAIPAGFES
jgi:hypothetical protein